MQRFLVFDAEAEALAIERAIYDFGAQVALAAGYNVSADGISGQSSGQTRADAQKTSAWDTPRQRLDGKWIVAHPETHPSYPDYQAGIDAMVAAFTVEEYSSEWFAAAES